MNSINQRIRVLMENGYSNQEAQDIVYFSANRKPNPRSEYAANRELANTVKDIGAGSLKALWDSEK